MLRIVSSIVAAAAMLAIPLTQADARHGGHGGGGWGGGGGMRMSSMHMSSMRSGPRVGSFNNFRSANVIGNRRVIFANNRFRHHRRFFVGVGAYGLYDTCWRWVPSVYGYRRVWVCDPYGYGYY
jgi:hypothetical protein